MSIVDFSSQGTTAARATRGRCPVMRPTLGNTIMDITVQEAVISSTEGEHDSATLRVTSKTLTNTDGIVDQPISFIYGWAPRTEVFYGYVVGVRTEESKRGVLDFSMSCLGPTYPMTRGKTRFWSGKSIPGVVQDLALVALLGYSGDSHTHLWAALAQTEESDWRLCNDLATRIGYSVFYRDGIVLCYDPLTLYSSTGPYARIISSGQTVQAEDRRMIEFAPKEVSKEGRDYLGVKFGYFTTSGDVQMITQPGEFKHYAFVPSLIRDQDEAKVLADSMVLQTNRWLYHAMARIWGDADIRPGMCIDIRSSNQVHYANLYDGKWLVRGVEQHMDLQEYQTMLVLSRPSPENIKIANITPYRPFWQFGNEGRSRPTLGLVEGKWVSSWTDSRVRSVLS
jgi:hypothetical protein